MRNELLKNNKFGFSITCTTRTMRAGEIDGKDYYFLSKEKFLAMRQNGELLEWAEVHGNFYGTPVKSVKDVLNAGKIPVMTIDVKGAAAVRKIFPDAVTIFIVPPSPKVLKERLTSRGESRENIDIRMNTAREEIKQAVLFDYLVVNDKLSAVIADVFRIVETQLLSVKNNLKIIENFAKQL